MIRKARPEDTKRVQELLKSANLPTDGLGDANLDLFVLEEKKKIVGSIGIEYHSPYALVRSLAVDAASRGAGKGRALLFHAINEAKEHNASAVYGLTNTIPDWLGRLQFKEVPRAKLPTELNASKELGDACPEDARAFSRSLKAPVSRERSAFLQSR